MSLLNSNHEVDHGEGIGSRAVNSWGITYVSEDKRNNYGTKSYGTELFDPEHFILMSLLTNKFYNKTEKLSQTILSFWKTI